MNITINRDNGDLITDHFHIGHTSDVAALRGIGKGSFELIDENGIYKYFSVCTLQLNSIAVNLIAHFNGNQVYFYFLQVQQGEDDWENWNEEKEKKYLDALVRLMEQSGFMNPEDLPWGHVQAQTDPRSGSISLVVAYYKAKR